MGKTIRLEDKVYLELEEIREKRETFSEAVERIIKVYATLKGISTILEPAHSLREFKHGPEEIRDIEVR